MKILNKINFNFKSILILIILLISLFYSIKNFTVVNLNFISSNLAIREGFLETNNVKFKGTHEPGNRYISLLYKNFSILKNFDLDELKKIIKKINQVKIYKDNYLHEYEIINTLKILSNTSNTFKKNTGVYIPLSLEKFWNLSCDTHMMPFLVPAITNMVFIRGLPNSDLESCFGHKDEYGYARYKAYNKKNVVENLLPRELCLYAKKENLDNVIEIFKIDNKYDYKIYNCK